MAPIAWLPRDAIAAAADRLAVREMVADWAATWFATGGASLTGFAAITSDGPWPSEAVALDDGVVLGVNGAATTAIGLLMFGEPGDGGTAADRAAIAAAAEQAIADLRHRIVQLIGLPRDTAWRSRRAGSGEAGYCFRIRIGAASLTLAVADRLLIASVKTRLRPAAARSLGEIALGLAPHPIALSARLGTCRLAMGELAGLAAGDVVILDRALTDPADLVVDRVPQRAHCTIAAGADTLDLTLA